MERRTKFEAVIAKKIAVASAEAQGMVADNLEYRKQLMTRINAGEIALEEAQKELASIKRNAKKKGLITRAQAYNRG